MLELQYVSKLYCEISVFVLLSTGRSAGAAFVLLVPDPKSGETGLIGP